MTNLFKIGPETDPDWFEKIDNLVDVTQINVIDAHDALMHFNGDRARCLTSILNRSYNPNKNPKPKCETEKQY